MAFRAELVGELDPHASRRGKTTDGSWRPDVGFHGEGVKITLRRAAGLTPKDALTVPLRLQVPVMNDLQRAYQFNWSTIDTLSDGQHARPMGPQLLQPQIDTMLMDRLAAQASSGLVVWSGTYQPQRLLEELLFIAGMHPKAKKRPSPFRLVLDQPNVWQDPVLNMIAVLTNVAPTQQQGQLATEFLSLSFMEYPQAKADRQYRQQHHATTHTLRTGDTLYELAKRYLHQASAWRAIANRNGITGVSPRSASDLASWAKRHHKTALTIPEVEYVGRVIGSGPGVAPAAGFGS